MDIDNLRIFCLVVEEGSISQAAKHLYLSQPGATRKIHQLEDYYGVALFNREPGRFTLSSLGNVLYPMAKSMITEFDRSKAVMAQLAGEAHVQLKIGASLTIGEYLLPGLLGSFKKSYPDYQVNLEIGNTPTIISRLLNDSIDLALVEGIVDHHEHLVVKKLKEDYLQLVCSPLHPWSKQKVVQPEELVNERMIWREETSGTRAIIEQFLKEAGVLDGMTYYMELGSTQAIKGAVEANLGISILPEVAIRKEVHQGSLCKVSLANLILKRPFWIIQKKQRYEQTGIMQLISFINESASH